MTKDTVAWLKSLPKPDDKAGWDKRLSDQFAGPKPIVPITDAELDTEFFEGETE